VTSRGGPLGGLREHLSRLGPAWPAPLEHHARIGSTSDRLKDLAREGAPELTVVTAEVQTAGRGRQGHTWISPRGNLYLSVLLRPSRDLAPVIPLVAGVAVHTALAGLGVDTRLKWPNDVLRDGRKLAGILAEAAAGSDGPDWVVLGLGLNVDPASDLPPGATSLSAESGRAFPLDEVPAAVLHELRLAYARADSSPRSALLAAWRKASVDWWGHTVSAREGEREVRGLAKGLDEDGALRLELDDGQIRRVTSGEVEQVRLAPHSPRD
jgi:BirA family biotin operon repressor/biotin-[acetyl-CoA-carboxylase] ligase